MFRAATTSKRYFNGSVLNQVCRGRFLSSSTGANWPIFDYDIDKLYETNYTNVPTLPVPKVEDTLKRYLETIRPLTSDSEYENTKRLAGEFKNSEQSKMLQAMLKDSFAHPGYPYSYIETFWDEMYQGGRWPVMINSNPYFSLPDSTNPADQAQLPRLSKLVSSVVCWWLKVEQGKLEADMERDKPMCMYGYGLVFGATRVPKVGRDVMTTNYHRKHVIVICNHQYYKVPVIDENNKPISPSDLESVLGLIKQQASQSDSDITRKQDVGILTSNERDFWAQERQRIIETDSINKHSIDAIDDCLFTVVLETESGSSLAERAKCFLHGKDGSNRWWDKHSFIGNEDGGLGVNFDHTFGDGLTWNRMMEESWAHMNGTKSRFSPLTSDYSGQLGNQEFEQLKWNLSAESVAAIESAHKNAQKEIANVDSHVLEFNDYGRNRMKEMKLSPDALTQMGFQLAYMKMHGTPCATYEACAMKSYLHGRTETIRSCTNESLAMTKAFLNDESDDEKRNKLAKACEMHVNVAKGAKACIDRYQGVDRHLHALKCIANKNDIKVDFFLDPVYSRASTWVLSTSNVTAPFLDLFGFGAVTGNGYGLGYMTLPDHVPIHITSYFDCKETSSEKFGNELTESFRTFDKLYK